MSNEPKHTATPWILEKDCDFILAEYKIDRIVCRFFDSEEEPYSNYKDNAARIVQCVNACEGLSNEDLEVKVQIQLSNLAYKVDRNAQERDKAESKLESVRAENAELIEALRVGRNELERAKMSLIQSDYSEQSSTIQSINNALTTLAKYEKP